MRCALLLTLCLFQPTAVAGSAPLCAPLGAPEEAVVRLADELLAGRIEGGGPLLDRLLDSPLGTLAPLVVELENRSGVRLDSHRELLLSLCEEATTRLDRATGSESERGRAFDFGLSSLKLLGRGEEMSELLALAAQRRDFRPDRAQARRVESTMQLLLEREERALRTLSREFHDLDPLLATIALRCTGRVQSPEALKTLITWLGSEPSLDAAILTRVEALAAKVRLAHGGDPFIAIRVALSSRFVGLRRQAASCLGALGDHESLHDLVALLSDTDPAVRRAAHHSLTRLTGFSFELDSPHWQRWLIDEESWWRDEAHEAALALRSDSPTDQVRGVKAFAPRRLHREEVVGLLSESLTRLGPPAATMAAVALGRMDAREAGQELADGLEHEDEHVRTACHEALRQIFDVQLPAEREAWRLHIAR